MGMKMDAGTLSIVAGIAAVVIVFAYGGVGQTLGSMARIPVSSIVIGTALAFFSLFFKTLKWMALTGNYTRKEAECYMGSYITLLMPGPAMDAMRIAIFKKFGRRPSMSIALITWERFTDAVPMTILLLSGLSLVLRSGNALFISFGALVIFMVLLYLVFYNRKFQSFIIRLGRGIVSEDSLKNMFSNGRMDAGRVALAIVMGSCFWILNIGVLQVIFTSLGYSIPFIKTISIFVLSMIAATFIPLPAGVGGMEGVFILFSGLPKHIVIAGLMAFRIITYGAQLLLSFISLGMRGRAPPAS